jgi:hypothetical protein
MMIGDSAVNNRTSGTRLEIFSSFAPQAMKIFYIGSLITK